MPAPYDYTMPVQSPMQALQQGFALGASALQAREAAQAIQMRQMQQQREAARQARLDEVLPGYLEEIQSGKMPGLSRILEVESLMPDQQRSMFEKYRQATGDEKRRNTAGTGLKIVSGLLSGDGQYGLGLLEEQLAAAKNSGDQQSVSDLEGLLKVAKINPRNAAATFLPQIYQVDPEFVKGSLEAMQKVRETELKETELTLARANEKFAGQNAANEAAKIAKSLDLTTAQIAEIRARTKALTEGQQLEAKGIVPADKRPEAEAKLRKEYNDQTKVFQEVASAYGRLQSAEPTAAGDLALIFQYMKMLDPGSVVREGEFANAQNAAGVGDRVRNIYNKLLSGERLNPEQRKQFTSQAGALFNTERQRAEVVRQGISRIAQGAGLNVENLFYGEMEAPAPQAGGQSRTVTVDY